MGRAKWNGVAASCAILSSMAYSAAAQFGGFQVPPSDYGTLNRPLRTITGDFDNDGDRDLAITEQNINRVTVLRNDGSGAFTTWQTLATTSGTYGIGTTDINSDGDLDLIVAGNGTVQIWRNNGLGTFSFSAGDSYAGPAVAESVAVLDVNRDGAPEFVVASNSGDDVRLYRNGGFGTYTTVSYTTAGNATIVWDMAVGDFNRDGWDDVALGASNRMGIFLNNTFNGFTTGAAGVYFAAGGLGFGIDAGDYDGDGWDDIVTTDGNNAANDGVRVWRNLRTAPVTFAQTALPMSSASTRAIGVEFVDLEGGGGDGRLDIVAVDEFSDGTYVWLNNGTSFPATPSNVYTFGITPRPPIMADLDNDGDQDAAIGQLNGSVVSILLNNSTIVGGPPPVARIDSPAAYPLSGSCICGNSGTISGVASVPGGVLQGWRLAYRPVSGNTFTTIATGNTSIADPGGTIGLWNTTLLPEDLYLIQLTVTSAGGLTATDEQVVWLSKNFDLVSFGNNAIAGRTACLSGDIVDGNCGPNTFVAQFRPLGGTTWTNVDPANPSYSGNRTNETFAGWNTTTVPDGDYELRVVATNGCGQNNTQVRTIEVDNTRPIGVITSPVNCVAQPGSVITIRGSASDANLAGWTVQYTGGNTNGWVTIASGNTNITNAVLANWNTAGLPRCEYTVRLIVTDQSVLDCSSGRNQTEFLTTFYVGCTPDLNKDGVLNIFDILRFFADFGAGCP